ncbi:Ig-like domain-containing protein [Poseidonibacter lekithochrous]|uniref:Ig-like domain-containing protein n=2 Tax=Poseidonibacter lekithochrous TaxID=1904463 RepID=UPI001D18FF0D|nr:Ig-like domain-containing protein [Poseidonibacter lekithochrous]QKJ22725.1 bacterial Ig-like domain-containing protein [Poseidonibacter lekithochrous]
MYVFYFKKIIFLFFLMFFLVACNNNSEINNSNNSNISGYAQKGPFKKDSIVKAYKLENGVKTNESIETKILDNKGSYKLDIPWSGPTQIEITGEYFDEVNGTYIQNGHLVSIINAKTNVEIKSNINILTHIASRNILQSLKQSPNIGIDEAKASAEKSVAKAFSLDLEENSLDELDLTDGQDQTKKRVNAQLLKISASILSTNNPEDTLEKLSEDIKDDGEINSDAMIAFEELKNKEENIDLNAISNNLETNLNIDNTPDNTVLDGTLTLHHNIKFTQKSNANLNIDIESNTITVSGIIGNAKISIRNGFYKIDNNDFISSESTITNGQTLKIKHISANKSDSNNTTTLTIAGVTIDFVSTTKKVITDIIVSDPVYSTKDITNENINVSFVSDMDILTPIGWTKNNNTYSKTYTNNINENIIFKDIHGNSTSKNVLIENIDKTAPIISGASYSIKELTNNDVEVTFISNDIDLLIPNGWTKTNTNIKKIYSNNVDETIVFSDKAGNTTNKKVVISNIDKTVPIASITYSTTSLTKEDILVTITLSKDVNTIEGWNKNAKVFTKTYSVNTSETITFSDSAGNSIEQDIAINNIDKINPIATVEYSTTDATNQDVTVTITLNEDVNAVDDWNKNGNVFTKIYSVNKSETITFTDLAGNNVLATVNITNIDKTNPVLNEVVYSTIIKTNSNVTATFTSDEDLTAPNNWLKTENSGTFTYKKTYSQNTSESVIFSDNVGNNVSKNISISNIDKDNPTATVEYSTTDATNQDVTVTITLNEDVNAVDGWNKNGNVFTKIYSVNKSETITFTDLAGNNVLATVNITNIDKTNPVLNEVVYSTIIKTNSNVTATFTSNEDLTAPNNWLKTENSGTFTYKKTYSQNTSESVIFSDNVGNNVSKNISISNIDKDNPTATVEYSTTDATNQDVTVTITLNEDVNAVDGWNKNENVFTKIYSLNKSETITFTDLAGNNVSVTVNITNIDKAEPIVSTATYSTTTKTKDNVTVTFTSDDNNLQTPNGWIKSSKNFTKVFDSNTNETVTFLDNLGNETNKNISISNIDKTAPEVSDAIYSEESTTRDPIIVTFSSNDSDILIPNGWAKNGNNFTKIFTTNTNVTVTFQDDVGNETPKSIIISNIDTSNPNLISFNGKDYIKVTSPKTGKIWLDRNLGANEVCNGSNDALCVGDYFQWGRKLNGHEKKNSLTSNELITSDVSNDGKFITVQSAPFHWEDAQRSDELWTGTNAINNVCPSGFKVPNKYELEAEFTNNSTVNPKDSFLKIPTSSYRSENGSMNVSNTDTYLWTSNSKSSLISFDAYVLRFADKISFTSIHTTKAIPLRCIKDYEDTVNPSLVSIKSGNKILNNNDINVSVVDDITIEFSEEIRTENIAINVILKRNGSTAISSEYANKIVTFNKRSLDTLLEKGYEYTLSITTNIKDIRGNNIETDHLITFETEAAPDTTLPMIDFTNSTLDSSSSNLKNSNVSVSNEIKIVFNESIDESTINKNNILLNNATNYSLKLENNKELIITLNENLSYETTYTLELKQDIQDLAGNALNPSTWGNNSGDKSISFTTQDAPDLTAPQVLSSNPNIADSDIGISSNITITFNEEIKNYDSSTVILKKDLDNTVITSTLTYNNKVLTLNPNTDLEENTAYKLTLNTGIKDSSNNPLKNDIEITFSTGTSSSCAGAVIDNICYESSSVQKNWADANTTCLEQNKTLVNKSLISDLDAFVSALSLTQDKEYWLNEESSYYSNYIEYYSSPYATDTWKINTSGSKSNDKYFLCMKESQAPIATLTKPLDSGSVSTKATFKITFDEEVKNISNTTIIFKDSSDSVISTTVTYTNKIASIKPNDDLNTSTEYTITLKPEITDLYANALVEKVFTFTSDSIAATCSGVELNSICYEKSSDELTHIIAKNTCQAENKTLVSKDSISDWTVFATALELDESKKYWLEENLNYVNKSYSGWSTSSHYSSSTQFFYICKSEKIAPSISSSTPINNASDISTKVNITITFNEDIKEDTLNSSNIILKKDGSDVELETTITYINKIATIKNTNDYATNSSYTITLNNGIKDLYENSLNETSISFTTSAIAATCAGEYINDKCYTKVSTQKSWTDANAQCTLVSKDSGLNWSDLATSLSLDTSKNYWLKEEHSSADGVSLKNSYGSWDTDSYFQSKSKSTLQEFICVE